MRKFPLWVLLFALTAGCSVKNVSTPELPAYHEIMTGLFKSAQEARFRALNLKVGKTRCPEELKEAGFDPDAPNVMALLGSEIRQYLEKAKEASTNQTARKDAEKPEQKTSLQENSTSFIYPIKRITISKDQFFFHTQDIFEHGVDGIYVVICKDRIVDYHDFYGRAVVDEPRKREQIGGSITDYIKTLFPFLVP